MSDPFVPGDFLVPRELVTPRFRLEPLGPEHNERDHAAWTSSIDHVRATPGYPDGSWPPVEGMSLERNLDDLRRHANDFEKRRGFTFTVLDQSSDDVIGCLYIYPDNTGNTDAEVQSWVRVDHAELDAVLYQVVSDWIAKEWPFTSVYYEPR
jgi:hypothetical protein